MSEQDLAYAVGIDRALQSLEHGWMCNGCLEKLRSEQKCIVCGADYDEDGGSALDDDGSGGRKFRATGGQALAVIAQARMAGTL